MNKGELIDLIAEKADISKTDAGTALNTVIEAIGDELKAGNKVSLLGFGTFSTSFRKARAGRNPQTGETIQIAAKTTVKFKAGKELNGKVN